MVSDYVLQEIRELPLKIRPKLGVTPDRVERFIQDLGKYTELRESVPEVFVHPEDPDDSHYVNLALASGCSVIVTRDDDLLRLMDVSRAIGQAFTTRFPQLRVFTPEQVAVEVRKPAS